MVFGWASAEYEMARGKRVGRLSTVAFVIFGWAWANYEIVGSWTGTNMVFGWASAEYEKARWKRVGR